MVVVAAGIGLIGPTAVAVIPAGASGAPARAASTSASMVRYHFTSVTPLGTNIFGTYDVPSDLNQAGKVVGGSSATNKIDRAFYYDGTTHEIGSLGTQRADVESVALGINDYNAVVGSSQINGPGDSGQHAFVWRGSALKDLGTGYADHRAGSFANDINNRGLIIGVHYASQPAPKRGVTWTNGVMKKLPDFGGKVGPYGTVSEPLAVNNSGLIVGEAAATGTERADGVYWRNGVIHDLGNLGGVNEGTLAYGVNDTGEIVGESADTSGHVGAFTYRDGTMTELGFLGRTFSGRFATAQGVNGHGVVVGAAQVCTSTSDCLDGGHSVATVWHNGVPTDLNQQVDGLPAGATLVVAFRIANTGTILVQTRLANGKDIVSGILTPEA